MQNIYLHLQVLVSPGLGGGLLLGRGYSHPVGSLPQRGGRDAVHLGGAGQAQLLGSAQALALGTFSCAGCSSPESLERQAHVTLGVGFVALAEGREGDDAGVGPGGVAGGGAAAGGGAHAQEGGGGHIVRHQHLPAHHRVFRVMSRDKKYEVQVCSLCPCPLASACYMCIAVENLVSSFS